MNENEIHAINMEQDINEHEIKASNKRSTTFGCK
jgi:hypothetical protein